jgi:hypothetical protein
VVDLLQLDISVCLDTPRAWVALAAGNQIEFRFSQVWWALVLRGQEWRARVAEVSSHTTSSQTNIISGVFRCVKRSHDNLGLELNSVLGGTTRGTRLRSVNRGAKLWPRHGNIANHGNPVLQLRCHGRV